MYYRRNGRIRTTYHRGNVIYSGVDYSNIRAAEKDADGEPDVILWDGGNNDFPFYDSDLKIVIVDPLRPGQRFRIIQVK